MKDKYKRYYKGVNEQIMDMLTVKNVIEFTDFVGTVMAVRTAEDGEYLAGVEYDGKGNPIGWVYCLYNKFYSDQEFLRLMNLKAFF